MRLIDKPSRDERRLENFKVENVLNKLTRKAQIHRGAPLQQTYTHPHTHPSPGRHNTSQSSSYLIPIDCYPGNHGGRPGLQHAVLEACAPSRQPPNPDLETFRPQLHHQILSTDLSFTLECPKHLYLLAVILTSPSRGPGFKPTTTTQRQRRAWPGPSIQQPARPPQPQDIRQGRSKLNAF